MSKFFNPVVLLASLVFGTVMVQAQQHQESLRPGDHLNYRINFEGEHAEFISSMVSWTLVGGAVPPSTQIGFATEMDTQVQRKGDEPFEISYTVPEYVASGDYRASVRALLGNGAEIRYSAEEVGLPTRAIDNPKTFTKPKIKAQELPSHP